MFGQFASDKSTKENLEKIPTVLNSARKSGMLASQDFVTLKAIISDNLNIYRYSLKTEHLKNFGTSIGELNILASNWHIHNK
jgi:hypothetical protein